MVPKSTPIMCDGCGLPASPEHLAERMYRLEQATRFRPIHVQLLFIALEPTPRVEDDFYRPPVVRTFFDSFLSALDILPEAGKPEGELNGHGSGISRLVEFQRRGYYLTYLSECPRITRNSPDSRTDADISRECISRLAPTLIKRIRFNYKPRHISLLGAALRPLHEVFERAGMSPLIDSYRGASLTVPADGPGWNLP